MDAAVEKARKAAIDELGALDALLKPLAPKVARQEALKKLIRGFADDQPADAAVTLPGERYLALLTPKTDEADIDLDAVYKRVGHKAFLAHVSMTLKALEQLIPHENERLPFVTREARGSRRVSTVPTGA